MKSLKPIESNTKAALTELKNQFSYFPTPHASPALSTPIPCSFKDQYGPLIDFLKEHYGLEFSKAIYEAQKSQSTSQSTQRHYNIKLELDPIYLLDFDIELGAHLLERDYEFIKHLEACCLKILAAELGPDCTLNPEYVYLTVKLAYYPWYMTVPVDEWHGFRYASQHQNKIFTIKGTIASLDTPDFVLKSRTFVCGFDKCRNHNRLIIIRLEEETYRIIKRNQDQELISQHVRVQALKSDYECSHCGLEMVQSMTDRVCFPFQNATMIPFNSSGCFSNTLKIKFENDLVNIGQIGDGLRLVGTIKSVFTKSKNEWLPESVFQVLDAKRISFNEQTKDFPFLTEILSNVEYSPFEKSREIASYLYPKCIPFMKLKWALLLSLVSISSNSNSHQKPLHIHIKTRDPLVLSLCHSAANLRKCIVWRHLDTLPKKDFAKNGILYVNTDTYHRKDHLTLKDLLNTKGLQVIIWSNYFYSKANEHFELYLNGDIGNQPELDEKISDFIINFTSMEDKSAEFQGYIAFASSIDPKWSIEAHEFLCKYWNALKVWFEKRKWDCFISFDFLLSIAMSHARINLQSHILLDDALVSILMSEESISTRLNESLLGFKALTANQENIKLLFQVPDSEIFYKFYEFVSKMI